MFTALVALSKLGKESAPIAVFQYLDNVGMAVGFFVNVRLKISPELRFSGLWVAVRL